VPTEDGKACRSTIPPQLAYHANRAPVTSGRLTTADAFGSFSEPLASTCQRLFCLKKLNETKS